MNNVLLTFLLSAEADTSASQSGVWQTAIQYIVYGVVIVVSIFLLVLLHKRTRLPRHGELKKKLSALLDYIKGLDPSGKRMDFLRSVSRAMYKADNLAFAADMLAEKERYADLGRIASLIGDARAELSEYKFGRKEPPEAGGVSAAAQKVEEALAVLDGVLERDRELKRKG